MERASARSTSARPSSGVEGRTACSREGGMDRGSSCADRGGGGEERCQSQEGGLTHIVVSRDRLQWRKEVPTGNEEYSAIRRRYIHRCNFQ